MNFYSLSYLDSDSIKQNMLAIKNDKRLDAVDLKRSVKIM